MARLESSTVVEQERLLSLVATQRQHIEELRTQLRETLEVQKQQKLQLVQQSPARRNVRKLLEQAAADNTTLASRTEELRAQRNALCVTKAALTAQVSELIRVTADDRQRDEQHRLLLHQLRHLCRLIQQQHLQKPEEQMAAVVAHIKQLYRERQELTEKLDAAMRSNSSSGTAKQRPAAVAASAPTGVVAPSSPTRLKLDQNATSHLIWTSSCPDPFDPQQQHPQSPKAPAAEGNNAQEDGSRSSSDTTDRPAAAACETEGCSESYNTAHSQLSDMSYMSPLRGVDSSSSLGRKVIRDDTPCSVNPASSAAAHCTPAASFASAVAAAADAGTPLSAQSLSAFSAGKGAMPSPRMRRALQALSPLRRCGLPRATSHASASAAAASSGCSSAGSSGSCSSRTTGTLADLLTPLSSGQQLQSTAVASLAAAAVGAPGTACSRLTPRGAPVPGGCGYGCGSSVSVASSSKPGSVGLCLQPEFRLAAAADGLWPSPAAARGSALGLAAAGSAVCSHRLWLQDAEDGEGAGGNFDAETLLGAVCPRALTDADFLLDSGDSCSGGIAAGSDSDAAKQQPDEASLQSVGPTGPTRGGRRSTVVSCVLWCSVSAAVAAASGAAAWHHKHAEVLHLLSLLQGGAAAAAGQACRCVAAGVRRVRLRVNKQREAAGRRVGCTAPAGAVEGDA